jgi:hypothetical protein
MKGFEKGREESLRREKERLGEGEGEKRGFEKRRVDDLRKGEMVWEETETV